MICARELSHNGGLVTLDTLRGKGRRKSFGSPSGRGAHNLRVFGSVLAVKRIETAI